MIRQINSSVFLVCFIQILSAYQIPNPIIKVYHKGFKVSIPHEEGLVLFHFVGKINSEITYNDVDVWHAGTRQVDADGYWTIENCETNLQIGDTIYYRLFAVYNGSPFRKDNGVFTVESYEDFVDSTLHTASQEEFSDPIINVYPKGLEISIPNEDGLTSFFFIGKVNSNIILDDVDFWRGSAMHADENGYWTIKVSNAELHLGDTLNCMLFKTRHGTLNSPINLTYKVKTYEVITAIEAGTYGLRDINQ